MRTEIGLVSGWDQWLLCGLIILVATAGKFGGALVAARWTGLSWRTSAALGILMNTRGLMELIVLNIGLDLGVISPTLFAMMVLMAIATTIMTTPVLQLLRADTSCVSSAAVIGHADGDAQQSPLAVDCRSERTDSAGRVSGYVAAAPTGCAAAASAPGSTGAPAASR
jgi:hypothetical protein